MEWDEAAEGVLTTLCRMVPETIRELARSSAHDEAEATAGERSATSVSVDDVVRGWIRTTPPEQRDGLVAVITRRQGRGHHRRCARDRRRDGQGLP
ncbi:MAG: DUF2621 family protein [Chloroflexi bacterium]|nr:MAG: DUF2621 family protein [Chloroflexota bacterium]